MANKTEKTENTAGEPMVKIRIPRDKNDNSDVFVGVNNRQWLLKRGMEHEVPACVAEVLRNAELMEEEAYAFIENLPESGE